MVRAQVKLLDYLGVQTVFLASGGSMGGMLVLQLAVSYPDRVKNAQILASTGWVSPQTIALNEVARQAIYADPTGITAITMTGPTAPGQGSGRRADD
jgi:homoserine O-acetyltransferase